MHQGSLRAALSLLIVSLAACTGATDGAETAQGEEDLTSLTARQRALTFEGIVYVESSATDAKILDAVHQQTQTAFGALLHSEVAVQSRELQNVDTASFKKRSVRVIDGAVTDDVGREMLEVRYTYKDNAVVPVKMARKTSLSLALLGQGAATKTKEIVELCTKNDAEAREDAASGLLWYDFDPQRASCRRAMEREQKVIDDASANLSDARKMIPSSRANRVYVPVTMQLARADNATRATYPEYDRLFSGSAEPGVLTVVMLSGRLAHHRVEARKDDGYYEWMAGLDVIFTDQPDFALTKVEPNENLSSFTIAGKKYENLDFKNFIQWTVYGSGWPQGMPASSRDDIATAVANTLDNHWLTFEKKVKVSIGGAPAKDLTIRIETLFGADEDATPHRRGIQRGDVFVYNGHSYIGYGPLDPDNFRPESFTRGYQILWFDSCVSYNYYEKDFFTLKAGGSKELDLVTNGLEAPEYMSGEAQGNFVSKLIGGSMPSYQTLLKAASATDALRVVDGEIDNRFDPKRKPIRLER